MFNRTIFKTQQYDVFKNKKQITHYPFPCHLCFSLEKQFQNDVTKQWRIKNWFLKQGEDKNLEK